MIPDYMVKVGAAGVAGSLQPFILKKFILPPENETAPYIGGLPGTMGSGAFLLNTALSIGAIGLAAYGAYARKGPLVDKEHQDMALAYGIPALVVGIALHYQGEYQMTPQRTMRLQAARPSAMNTITVRPGSAMNVGARVVPPTGPEYNPVF